MQFKNALLAVSVSVFVLSQSVATAQHSQSGDLSISSDVGAVKLKGSSAYDAKNDRYLLTGGGTNMWNTQDELHMITRKMKGNFILQAHASLTKISSPSGSDASSAIEYPETPDPHRKYGLIVRSSLEPDAPYLDIAVHGDGMLTSMQFRRTKGAITEQIRCAVDLPSELQLVRHGDKYIAQVAQYGEEYSRVGHEPNTTTEIELDLGDEVYVGLFVCSHNPDHNVSAMFDNVRLSVPAKDDFRPYRDYIGSRLELLDLSTGKRRIIHTTDDSMQAPNWTIDGKFLIYNRNGKMYRFELATGNVSQLDTGDVVNNNNDHVLSFDGKMLGISSSSGNPRKSTIYTLPATGGKPTQVTDNANHSYLHGWSPDGKFLIYTAERNGDYDIHRCTVDGKDETNLTKTAGLDDGSEYTPDGSQIYFNSTRSGLMQIWKMKADGSGQTQVTDDAHNNWFPHLAPDGKSFVMISYSKDIEPTDHPFYKYVTLRRVNVDGGTPKTIAYLYGGQGTINVPSWSPDGKYIAFVSNSDAL
jgi:Tol biopolymer transport system component